MSPPSNDGTSTSARPLTEELRAWAARYRGPSASLPARSTEQPAGSSNASGEASTATGPASEAGHSSSSSDQFTVHLKTIDNATHPVCVQPHFRVSDLKQLAEPLVSVPVHRQRLVFRGKVLHDEELLSSCQLNEADVLHVVARPEGW